MGVVLLDAAAAAGIRMTLLDTCYLQAGMMGEPLSPTQQRFSDSDVDAWAARASALVARPTAHIGAAIHSVRSVGPESMTVVAEWAAARNAPVHAHVSEQPAENEQCSAALNCTPMELLEHQGVLSERFTAVHATHLLDHDIDLLRLSDSTCCICATTERDLADGIGPTDRLRAAGIPMTIGSDSHAVIDPFEETRGIELDERLGSLRRGTHQPGALLAGATQEGYRSLGWPDGGRLAADCLADFTTVALTSPRLAGIDAARSAAAVVFAATAADVAHVVVGGRVIVADGVHQTIDVAAELDRSVRQVWT
jgi:formiminoglutamate deiminase